MTHPAIPVRIDSSRPIFMEADADAFGEVFAAMSSDDQAEVLGAIAKHMAQHRAQWDFIAIEMEDEKHASSRRDWSDFVAQFPENGGVK